MGPRMKQRNKESNLSARTRVHVRLTSASYMFVLDVRLTCFSFIGRESEWKDGGERHGSASLVCDAT